MDSDLVHNRRNRRVHRDIYSGWTLRGAYPVACLAMSYRAVIFDLGGVVMPSPLDAFRAYESEAGLPHRFLSEIVLAGGENGAWSQLERGEMNLEEFADTFESECAMAGGTVVVADLFASITQASAPRPEMLTAVRRIRAEGLAVGALTNNWRDTKPGESAPSAGADQTVTFLGELFDVVVESAVEGIRKPNPKIYEIACARLNVEPPETVFLDDLGTNLKPARAIGMTTIKVGDPFVALAELEAILEFSLQES